MFSYVIRQFIKTQGFCPKPRDFSRPVQKVYFLKFMNFFLPGKIYHIAQFLVRYSCPNWYDLLREKAYQLGRISGFSRTFTYQLGHEYCT